MTSDLFVLLKINDTIPLIMKLLQLLILFILIAMSSNAQQAKDYLNLDVDKVLVGQFLGTDTVYYRFEKSFNDNGDTICYYLRKFQNRENSSRIFTAYNKDTLIIGSYLVFDPERFNGISSQELKIVVPKSGETIEHDYQNSFDMQVTDFKMTTEILKEYTDAFGNIHSDVVKVDQYNITDDYHYYTYLAKGIGIIYQGPADRAEKLYLYSILESR